MTLPEWTAGVHHDGSARYVSEPLPRLGQIVQLKLRIPSGAPIVRVFVRTAPDGENHFAPMHRTTDDGVIQCWEGDLHISMPKNHYRFKMITETGEAYHFNAAGISRVDRPDWFDFRIVADMQAPTWVYDTVFYEIFPDRFHNGDPDLTPQPGAWTYRNFPVSNQGWDELPKPYKEAGNVNFYGGDLPGIAQKLDYLEDLGVNGIYLTPIFVSTSNHRYDVSDFYHIDPHVGGDDGLAALRAALDAKNFRIILDITLNHCGFQNHWFTDAQKDLHSETAEYFTFYNDDPNQYECWLGVRSLPKLNYRSEKLRGVMWANDDSIMRRWLRPPHRIDGWRLDVANMQGKQGPYQLGHKIGRALRRAVKTENPQAYIFGEHFYDGTPHLQGDELDASMNYSGFTFALWQWLSGRENGLEWRPESVDTVLLPAEDMATQWATYRAAIPYAVQLQQFLLLDSHDTARISLKMLGDKALIRLAAFMQMVYPGVPCVYYGDEIGLEGGVDPDNRRAMPWDESKWDKDLLAFYKKIIGLRRTQSALRTGGYQQLFAQGDVFAFQRESVDQRLIMVGYRGDETRAILWLPLGAAGIREGAKLTDLMGSGEYTVSEGGIMLRDVRRGAGYILQEV
jgi:alpha-glucosidase